MIQLRPEIRMAMGGHEDAVSALYQRVGPLAFRLARAILGDPTAAEDVLQEAFLRIWRRRERLQAPDALDGYAVSAVRNLAYKRIRRQKVEGAAKERLERKVVLVTTPVEPEGAVPPLDSALLALPPEQREVIHLRVYEGLPMTTIAARTGVPLGTVHSRYRYALTKLRAELSRGAK